MSWQGERQPPVSNRAKNSRRAIIVCNVLSWLFGLTMIIVCLIINYDRQLVQVRENLQLFGNYKLGLVIAICVAIGVCVVSLLGCCVTWHRSSKGLLVYSVICLLFMIGEISVMVLVFKYTTSDRMADILSELLQKIIIRIRLNKLQAEQFMDDLQETLKCCGGFSFEDYTQQQMELPPSCYFDGTNVYHAGCGETLMQHFNANGLAVGLIAVAILLLQISLVACSWTIFFSKRELRKRINASKV